MQKQIRLLLVSLSLVAVLSVPALAKTLEQKSSLMGKEVSVKEQLDAVASGNGVLANTSAKFLGRALPLIASKVEFVRDQAANRLENLIESQNNELYVNGIKIYTGSGSHENGTYSYSGSVPLTQLAIPVFSYTVGPLVLQVDAGVEYEASMLAKLTPVLNLDELSASSSSVDPTLPLVEASISASLDTETVASGFVEGSAKVLVIRAGIGGAVNILDGNASVAASVALDQAPLLTYDGKLQVLNGKIYAFVDYRKITGWKRWANYNLYSWAGKCWAMGGQSCTASN